MDDFAALNAKREGVTTLPSGVQYEILTEGKGRRPAPSDAVIIQYEGSLTTGVVFDSTYEDEEPMRLQLDEIVVPGLKEALALMQEGAKWRIVVRRAWGSVPPATTSCAGVTSSTWSSWFPSIRPRGASSSASRLGARRRSAASRGRGSQRSPPQPVRG